MMLGGARDRSKHLSRAAMVALFLTSLAAAPLASVPAAAQSTPATDLPVWHHTASWRSTPPPLWTALDWPAGHEAGGIGRDPATGRVFVTDRTADAVRAYGPDGLFEGSVGQSGSGPLQFNQPRDVAVLADGRLAVSDTGNDRVQVVEPTGEAIVSWKVGGPRGIVVVGDRLYVLAGRDRAILAFDAFGAPIGIILLPEIAADAETLFWLGDVPGTDPPRARFRLPLPGSGRVLEIEEGSGRVLFAPGVPGARTILRRGLWTLAGTATGLLGVHDRGDDRLHFPLGSVGDLAHDGGDGAWAATSNGPVHLPDLERAITGSRTERGWLHAPRRIAAGLAGVVIADDPAWPQIRWRGHVWQPEAAAGSRAAAGIDLTLAAEVGDIEDVAVRGDDVFALTTNRGLARLRDETWSAFAPRPSGAAWPTRLAAVPAGSRVAPPSAAVAVLDTGLATVRWLDRDLGPVGVIDLPDELRAPAIVDLAVITRPNGQPGLLLAESIRRRLVVLDGAGAIVATLALPDVPWALAALPGSRFAVLLASGWIAVGDETGLQTSFHAGAARDSLDVVAGATAGDAARDIAADAAGTLYVADATGAVRVLDPVDAQGAFQPPPQSPTPSDVACGPTLLADASPPIVSTGDPVTLTLAIAGRCLAADPPAGGSDPSTPAVVLLLAHGDAAAATWDGVRDEAARFLADVADGGAGVAVVTYADRAARLLPWEEDLSPIAASLAAREASGPTNLASGLEAARGAIARAAAHPRHIVLVATGAHDGEDAAFDEALAGITADGMTVHVVNVTADDVARRTESDANLARLTASGPGGLAVAAPTRAALRHALAAVARTIVPGALLVEATIDMVAQEALPIDRSVVPGSPPPWTPGALEHAGWRASLPLVALTEGLWPATSDAVLRANRPDNPMASEPTRWDFPIPLVRVENRAAPTLAPTATPTSRTPVPTAIPTFGPSPTPSPSPPPTPTPPDSPTADATRDTATTASPMPMVTATGEPGSATPGSMTPPPGTARPDLTGTPFSATPPIDQTATPTPGFVLWLPLTVRR